MNCFRRFEIQRAKQIADKKVEYVKRKLNRSQAFLVFILFFLMCFPVRAVIYEPVRVTQSQIQIDDYAIDIASIKPPISPIDILINIKQIYARGLPLQKEFYSNYNLNNVLGFRNFFTGPVENGRSDIISRAAETPDFLKINPKNDMYPAIYITTGIDYKRTWHIHAFLYLALQSWRPSLTELEKIFGLKWRKIRTKYYDGSPPPPKVMHGDETLLFEFEGPSFMWSATAELDENADLKNLNMYEEAN